MKELPKAYEPQKYEDSIYKRWEDSGFFNPDNLEGEPFSIMMPPPNVTGVLHLGHALENSLMDAMARYQRMLGKKVLIVPGTDHAALPTQAKVEKMLMEQGMKNPRQELGREKLVEKIREFAEVSRATILSQVKKMGTSCDWSRLAYTFDASRNIAVNELFRRMYQDGLIYRGYRVVNWSTKGQSTCSDDEIEYVERKSVLYTFKYSKDFPITIATTRPETKLGDSAVAVHPSDKRYQKYIGQTFLVDVGAQKPLNIKIIADESVDPKFGTGALGVTPAHSPIDFLIFEKQKANGNPIGMIQVIGLDGRMTKEAGAYAGFRVEEAREKFVFWLTEQGLMEKEPEEVVQNVGTSDRFKDVIEALPMTQWWLDVQKMIPTSGKSLRDLMREALTTGLNGDNTQKVNITPERFTKLYLNRVENLRDWCLSRQTWWGHRIPVWYRGEEIFVGNGSPDGEGWEQDPDTLDTWFSSGSWTFSTLGWPEKTNDLKIFHPTSWIQMGYEILYLWLMRMVLMSAYALNEIPFKEAYIHGILRDEHGNKFSKSSGNGIDPVDAIAEFGCDGLRLSVLSGISAGNDSSFYREKVEGSRNFVNKLWNISRYVFLQIDNADKNISAPVAKTLADQWILTRTEKIKAECEKLMNRFDFSLTIENLRAFTWNDFADWYLEIAKVEGNKQEILNYILNTILKLWHPFIPFVTEQIWSEVYGEKEMLMVEKWPKVNISKLDEKYGQDFEIIKNIITGIRSLRSDNKIEPVKKLNSIISAGSKLEVLQQNSENIKTLARLEDLEIVEKAQKSPTASGFVEGTVEIFIELAGAIDLDKEKERLQKEFESLTKFINGLEKKLANEEFVKNAPPIVIEKERQKLQEAQIKLDKIESQL